MVLLDLLGQRWTLRILWELRELPATFRELRTRCDEVSPTLLNTRLRELRDAGIVELGDAGYATTPLGQDLIAALAPVNAWAKRWHAETRERRPPRTPPSSRGSARRSRDRNRDTRRA
jgi:DNA-binding HxlR family transcriptional regulator